MTCLQWELPNGLSVIAEALPAAQSLSFGFFVRAGSRDESPEEHGVSHFLEHMVFKGTATHTAADVNRKFDELGANYNAATGEEVTTYYTTVLPEFFEPAFELQADILFPSLRDDDFLTEKQVILEEISMYDDQPSYVAYDRVMSRYFAHHPLGRTVLGTRESVTALTPEVMRAYHRRRYTAGNIVLAVAGRFNETQVRRLIDQCCGDWPAGRPERLLLPARTETANEWIERPELKQQHVMQLAPAPALNDRLRYSADLLSMVLGDDGNSRLYWDLVATGEADQAGIQYQDFEDAGTWLTFLSGPAEETAEHLARIKEVYEQVQEHGVTADEWQLAKAKATTQLVTRGERPMSRLNSLGNDWLLLREYLPLSSELEIFESLTVDDARLVLDQFPLAPLTTVGVGPWDGVSRR
jgi:predicted Zn-dependent peptidase